MLQCDTLKVMEPANGAAGLESLSVPPRLLSITAFSTGLGYFATKYLGDCLKPVLLYKEPSLLPDSHPHLVELSWFSLLRRQASYPSRSQRVPEGLN